MVTSILLKFMGNKLKKLQILIRAQIEKKLPNNICIKLNFRHDHQISAKSFHKKYFLFFNELTPLTAVVPDLSKFKHAFVHRSSIINRQEVKHASYGSLL